MGFSGEVVSYFLDTNICIYFLNGTYTTIREQLSTKKPQEIKISTVVMAELLFGAENSGRVRENLKKVRDFLSPFELLAFDPKAAEIYANQRALLQKSGKPIASNDLMIAAITLAHQGILVTHNEKDFVRIKKLKIENWVK